MELSFFEALTVIISLLALLLSIKAYRNTLKVQDDKGLALKKSAEYQIDRLLKHCSALPSSPVSVESERFNEYAIVCESGSKLLDSVGGEIVAAFTDESQHVVNLEVHLKSLSQERYISELKEVELIRSLRNVYGELVYLAVARKKFLWIGSDYDDIKEFSDGHLEWIMKRLSVFSSKAISLLLK